jgi:tRNA-modifying protein YgfZ
VTRVSTAQAIYAALLTPQGKYLHDFFLVEAGETLLLEGELQRLPDLQRRLSLYKLRSKVTIGRSDLAAFAVFGDGASRALGLAAERGAAGAVGDGFAFTDPRLAELGARVLLPEPVGKPFLEALGFRQAEFRAYDRLRLAFGVPDGSRDLIVEKSILLESGFDELAGVDWKKGCYVGQELTARTKYRGLIRKRLMPLRIAGTPPAPGTLIMAGAEEAGELRSSDEDLGIGLMRLDAVEKGLELRAGEATITPMKPEWASW